MPIEVEVVSRCANITESADIDHPGQRASWCCPTTFAADHITFGELRIVEGDDVISFVVYGGVVDVRPDKVVVLADDAESVYELDMDQIQAARDRARQLMEEGVGGEQRAQIAQELRRAEIAAKIRGRLTERPGQRIRSLEENNE